MKIIIRHRCYIPYYDSFYRTLWITTFYNAADGIMVVFSITDEASYEMLQDLHQQVDRNLKDTVSSALITC